MNENSGEKSGEQQQDEANDMKQQDEAISSECETINLANTIKTLNSQMRDESFLLVNTMNWEDNIFIELNQTNSSASQTSELINERIKYAGWVPSSEHRTLLSYQSKVLGIDECLIYMFEWDRVNNYF